METTQPASILIVDDDQTVCKTISLFLSSKKYEMTSCQDSEEALVLLEEKQFDLLFLDIDLPRLSGLDLLHIIRKRMSALELPIIMLTVSDDTDDIVKSLDGGANDYIVKPGSLPILIARIELQLSIKSMSEALQTQKEKLERKVINTEIAYELAKANLESEMDTRLEAEKALMISEQRYEELYNNMPAMYFNLDMQGNIQSVNRFGAYMLGFQKNELIDQPIFSFYHPEDRNIARQYIKETIYDQKRLHRWELRKLQKNGGVLLLRETVRMVEHRDGTCSVLMVCVEPTQSNKTEKTIQ